ncbi:chymotrypsin-1-like [Uranotaenia lowii]|uniref:chymotrypsin-1-like n=1 Tax=Uranotaenia lowii TaxID=190385 RepID=UPI002478BF86|nr:chymotrypsin-1-like [Uranotaenia lowii]
MEQLKLGGVLILVLGLLEFVRLEAVSKLNPYPPVVAIYGPRNKFVCNGVIVDKGRVLVAADCLTFVRNDSEVLGASEDFHVVMETHNIDLFEKGKAMSGHGKYVDTALDHYVSVESFTVHPNATGPYAYDVAMLEVTEDRPFDRSAIAEIVEEDVRTSGLNSVVQIYGWGTLSTGESNEDKQEYFKTRVVEMYLVPAKNCSVVGDVFLLDQHLCMFPVNNVTICAGFSGAPIVLNGKLIGIVAFGDESCDLTSPVIGTSLEIFKEFILPKSWFSQIIEHMKIFFGSIASFFSFF